MEKYFEQDRKLYASGMSQEARENKIIFTQGIGSYLYDMNGKKYLDLASGIFTNSLGQCHPKLLDAQIKQLKKLGNIHDFPCDIRLELLTSLNKLTPNHINNFAFQSTGAEAVETALKAAYTFINEENLNVLTFKNGYHGKTGGIRLIQGWRYRSEPFKEPVKVNFPICQNCPFNKSKVSCNLECAHSIVKTIENDPTIKIFIFEPILGAGGIHIPPTGFWKIVSAGCKKNNVLMIDDEIFVSGGKIGTFLACDYFNFEPDIILMSKGISSGYPFSVVAGRKEILSNKYFSNPGDVSSTYASQPFNIATALATLKIIEEEKLIDNVRFLDKIIADECDNLKSNYSFIYDVRQIGLLFSIEFADYNNIKGHELCSIFNKKCLSKGLKVSIGGNIIRMGPPLNITLSEIKEAFSIMNESLSEMQKEVDK